MTALVLWCSALLLAVAGVVLQVLGGERGVLELFQSLWLLVFPTVGVVVARRRPENPIGWILLVSGLGLVIEDAGIAYAEHGLVHAPGSVPVPAIVGVVADAFWVPSILLAFTFMFLLAPDGHLPTRRWRTVAWAASVAMALSVPATIIDPGSLYAVEGHPNPLGWDAAGGLVTAVQAVVLPTTFVSALLAGVAFILRFRRSTGLARLQLRPLAAAAVVLVVATFLLPVYVALFEDVVVASLVYDLGMALPPVAVAVGILRYRLYDLDRFISRTVSYVVITGLLAGVYASVVLGAQWVVGPADAPDLVIATATLLVAALFRPLRARVQEVVDRRFNRSRYDAARVVEDFGAGLRTETDLHVLTRDLAGVVGRTMEPHTAWLWLPERG